MDLPGVTDSVTRAREACTQLRWHNALRRRIPEAAAEARVRGARASAALDGAELPVDKVRELVVGLRPWDDGDPVQRVVRAAVRVADEAAEVDAAGLRSAGQVLARLHLAASAGQADAGAVGRPRGADAQVRELVEVGPVPPAAAAAERLQGVLGLLGESAGSNGILVAAVAHAEIATARPFASGNGLVARGVERVVLRVLGVDPTGVAVPEAGHLKGGTAEYAGALAAYATGSSEGVALWLVHAADAVASAAAEGVRIADSVMAGRFSVPPNC